MVQHTATTLAERLRQLREQHWPGVVVTQKQLAVALGVSTPLISSWEKGTVPPPKRLADYAQFYATRRSVERHPYRLIKDLTQEEAEVRDGLRSELDKLREVPPKGPSHAAASPLGGPWAFGDTNNVSLLCAEVPKAQLELLANPEDPNRPYAELYSYADLDALVELFGHVRAANPRSRVILRKTQGSGRLHSDDLTTHLVMLGGGDWNTMTDNAMAEVPVEQISDADNPANSRFEVVKGGKTRPFAATLNARGNLTEDVGLFVRAPSPYNSKRTLTICFAMYSKGTFGVVRALTDDRFRDRNSEFLRTEFGNAQSFALLTKIHMIGNAVLTPDWTQDGTVLYTWSRPSAKDAT